MNDDKFRDLLFLLIPLGIGLNLAFLFVMGVVLPVRPGVLVLLSSTIWGLISVKVTGLCLLPRLMIVLYSLPFITTMGYLLYVDYSWWSTGARSQLLADPLLVSQMITVGVVGLSGLLAGMAMAQLSETKRKQSKISKRLGQSCPRRGSLGFICFHLLLGMALGLSWVHAPTSTILVAEYASEGTSGIYKDWNFNASYLLSYILIIALFIDAEGSRGGARKWKIGSVLAVSLFIIIFLQLLRGDRESIGLIAGLMALYMTTTDRGGVIHKRVSVDWRRIRKMILLGLVTVVVFVGVGSARSTLSTPEATSFETLQAGTAQNAWTAVLLTNLGMAAEYRYGQMEYYYGQTYLDYVLSTPPGVVTRVLGIERPLEPERGPAWWFGNISAGGIHVALVPFKNFGILGVFIVLGIYGLLIARCEAMNGPVVFWRRLIYGAVVLSSFRWFWYGDMNIIRGLMGAALIGMLYKVARLGRHISKIGCP